MVKWLLAIIMVLHGLIHLMGGLNELNLAEIQGLSGKTLFPLPEYAHTMLGVVWFIAVPLFILSAIGLVANRKWWKNIAAIAITVSQVLIVLWWPDAKMGTIPNIIILLRLLV